jgi:prepilin-type N-terminal cleavage/methylation domain-containing protein
MSGLCYNSRMKIHPSYKKGFTLVELMVAIAIMALLTGIITVNLTKSRAKARDAKRISDIGQLQLALELYFDRCNKYPMPAPAMNGNANQSFAIDPASSCTTANGTVITMSTFMSNIPIPPKGAIDPFHNIAYQYKVPNNEVNFSIDPTDYLLGAQLESYNEVLKDDIDIPPISFGDAVSCGDNTTTTFYYCVGPQ